MPSTVRACTEPGHATPVDVAQALKHAKDASKLLAASGTALTDFEAAAAAWQQTSRELDSALREMGDVGHLLQVLQAEAAQLAEQVSNAAQSQPSRGSAADG